MPGGRDASILPALTTPFERGEVATARLVANLARFQRLELAGYLVLGSTGEAVLLDRDERLRVLEAARGAIPSTRRLVAGVVAESTAAAIDEARRYAEAGADRLLVATPHYYAAWMTAQALREHFARVADASPVPVLLYNVPKFTGLTIPPEVVAALSGHGNVAGLKESSGDADYLAEVLRCAGDSFSVYCGAAGIVDAALARGAAGAILAAAVAFPEPFLAVARGAAGAQASIAEAARVIAGEHGIAGLKAAMDHRGLFGGAVRGPLRSLSAPARARVGRIVDALVDGGALPGRELSPDPGP